MGEHGGERIKGGGWLLSVERLDFANLSCARAGRLNFANSSTCALELAELRVVGAQVSMGRVGKLSFANSSMQVLESAKLVEQEQRT